MERPKEYMNKQKEKERQQAVLDHRSEQLDPTHPKYYRARGDTQEVASLKAEVETLKCREAARKTKP